MSGLSVVIPSRDVRNLSVSVPAIRRHEPSARIIIVDDGADWRLMATLPGPGPHYESIVGTKPFVFARNCNRGIVWAGDDDVILANDDAILESPGGFTAMQEYAAQHPEFGLISATTNVAGNPAQHRRALTGVRIAGDCPGNSFPTVAFVCVLIPRRTIQAVGLLDERFGGVTAQGAPIYGWDDTDYCRRVGEAGLRIGIDDGCYVDHGKLRSTFRSVPFDMEAGRQIYLQKWGSM